MVKLLSAQCPLEHVCIFAQVSESSFDELLDGLSWSGEDDVEEGFLHRLLSPAGNLQHLLQEAWSKMTLEMSPVLLASIVVLGLIRHVPDGRDVELLICSGSMMAVVDGAVVEEQVDLLIATSSSNVSEEADELLGVEAIFLDGVGEKAMAGAYC